METISLQVGLLFNDRGLENCCDCCHAVLAAGSWLVGIKIGDRQLVIARTLEKSCSCGGEVKVMYLFETREAAAEIAHAIASTLSSKGLHGLDIFEIEPLERRMLN
jgi:hypothetical protein